MNGTVEREGEEFPRVHACSTVDRPLEHHGREHGPQKSGPFVSIFGFLARAHGLCE